MKLLQKLSYKTVVGKVNRRELPEDKSDLLVMRVIGQASKSITVNTDFGASIGFIGNFEATNVITGEVFRSGKMFLPPVAANLLDGAVAAANGGAVDFAFDIGVKEADNQIGYEYTASPLIEAGANDPISILKANLIKNAPALPAPTKAPQPQLTGAGQDDEEKPAPKTGGKKK